ncbi:hypothetical protein ONZ45_g2773 [Pleurotus djamor]|nr:hypothetical protein ONZ45_g2773 [Pleurotus djamor]
MAKKKKSSGKAAPPVPIAESVDDEDLMNDLLDQLDAKDRSVRVESAHILNQMDLDKQAEAIEKTKRTDSKDRFLARQVEPSAGLVGAILKLAGQESCCVSQVLCT